MGKLRDWLGLSVREEAPPSDPSTALNIPPRDPATTSVSPGDAFSLSIVYRAIGIHAVSAKQLSIGAFRGGSELDAKQTPSWVNQPDINQTRSAFLEETVVSLACTGNAYWRITRNDRGLVSNLEPLNPLDMLVKATKSGRVTGYSYGGVDLKPEEVKHLKLLRVPGSVTGLGPIQAAQRELRGALDLRDYASNWFQEGGVPTGLLKSDQILTADQAKDAKTAWAESQGAKRGVAVLGAGLNYAPVYLSPADAQFLESQQFTTTQIARLFGIPSSLMLAAVEGTSQSYANVAQDWLAYTRFSLMSYLIEIEDAFSTLLVRGTEARFNIEALLRSDTQTRYTTYESGIRAGWMLRSEARAIEGLPTIPGIDDQPAPATPTQEVAA